MNFRRVYAIFLRQIILLKKGHFRVMSLFYWSTIDLVLWGLLSQYLNRTAGTGFSFVSTLVGAIILLSFFFRVVQGITVAFLEDVWSRNFLNLFASPLAIHEYILGLILVSVFDTAVSLAFMAVLAWLLFAFNIFRFGLALIPFAAVLFMFGWAIGITATGIMLRLGPSAEILAWSIPALMTPISAVFYPVSALPYTLQILARFIPNSYVFEGMRAVVLSGSLDLQKLFMAFALATLYCAAAYAYLFFSYKKVLRRGLFARFMTQ